MNDTVDWKEIAMAAWDSESWGELGREYAQQMRSLFDRYPMKGNGPDKSEIKDEPPPRDDGDASLPDGIWCDGDAAPAPRPKLIEGLLSTTGLCFLGGQGSAGKSFIAVAIAVALATGEPFFGRAVNEKVGTLIIAAEGREDMQARIAAAKKHIGIEGDLPVLWMAVPTFGDSFLRDLDQINLWMQVKHNVRLGAIMLDTVSAAFDLKEEDNNAEAARACKVLRRIGEHVSAVMVPLHHHGKDPARGLRGASAWTANADMVLGVDADIAPDGTVSNRKLTVVKDRSGIQGPVSAFELVPVELATEDGAHFTNLAVAPVEAATTAAASKWTSNAMRNLKRALDIVLPAHGREECPYADGPVVRAVDSKIVEAEFARINVVNSEPEKAKHAQHQAYNRALRSAQDRALIGIKNQPDGAQIVWLGTAGERYWDMGNVRTHGTTP